MPPLHSHPYGWLASSPRTLLSIDHSQGTIMDVEKPNDRTHRIDIAAKFIRGFANSKLRHGMRAAAALILDGNEPVTRVVDDWFSVSLCSKQLVMAELMDRSKEKVAIGTFPYTIDPACLRPFHRRFIPIVFPHRPGSSTLQVASSDGRIVLIALEDLSFENGLPQWDKGPSGLAKGDWTWIRGDQVWMLGENGGGMAIWLELKISQSSQNQVCVLMELQSSIY